jgi:hypothetical protein
MGLLLTRPSRTYFIPQPLTGLGIPSTPRTKTGMDAFPPHSPSSVPETETIRSPCREQARDPIHTTRVGFGWITRLRPRPTHSCLLVCHIDSQGHVSFHATQTSIARGGHGRPWKTFSHLRTTEAAPRFPRDIPPGGRKDHSNPDLLER